MDTKQVQLYQRAIKILKIGDFTELTYIKGKLANHTRLRLIKELSDITLYKNFDNFNKAYQILKIDNNDINHSSDCCNDCGGLTLNMLINVGNYKLAYEIIKNLSADISTNSKLSYNSPINLIVSQPEKNNSAYFKLLHYMLLQYHNLHRQRGPYAYNKILKYSHSENRDHCINIINIYQILYVLPRGYMAYIPQDIINMLIEKYT